MEAKVLFLSERRLAGLFRRAALHHIRRELRDTADTLGEAAFLLAGLSGREAALRFVREWELAVETERSGLPAPTAPAAWIHLAQELASLLENGGDWLVYLDSRWRVESGRLGWSRRLIFGVLSFLSFGLSGLIAFLLARHALAGDWDGLAVGAMHSPGEKLLSLCLIFGRVAGTVLMIEHGFVWARKALSGQGEESRVLFLSAGDGLALVGSPHEG